MSNPELEAEICKASTSSSSCSSSPSSCSLFYDNTIQSLDDTNESKLNDMNHKIITKLNQMGSKIVYSDTDSTYSEVKSLDESDTDVRITIKSQDEKIFHIAKKSAIQSILLSTMLEKEDSNSEIIPLPNIIGNVLQKVVTFLDYTVNTALPEIDKPLKFDKFDQVVPEWFCKFIDIDQEMLFDIILAANYMDIKSLFDLGCAKVASMIKNKTSEEIRKTFNIVNDFTPEEESAIRAENKWAEENS